MAQPFFSYSNKKQRIEPIDALPDFLNSLGWKNCCSKVQPLGAGTEIAGYSSSCEPFD